MSSLGIDVTQIPVLIGEFVGLPPALAGTIMAVAITVGFLVGLSILKVKELGLMIGGVGILAIFTIMQWFDPWIMAIVALIGAVLIGDWISKRGQE